MYNELFPKPCIRLFSTSGTHGCGSPPKGTLGALFGVSNEEELSSLESSGDKDRSVLLAPEMLERSVVDRLAAAGHVVSVLVSNSSSTITRSSPFSPDPKSRWNALGDGLSEALVPFPLALLSTEDTAQVAAMVERNRDVVGYSSHPQHVADFRFYMGPDGGVDSLKCLAEAHCKPLGGASVWGVVGGLPEPNPSGEFVLASANLDSTALFHDLAFGANAGVSGIVSLLGAAHALGAHRAELRALPRQVVFGLFQGEAFGSIGSRRFVSDTGSDGGCVLPDVKTANASCLDPPRNNVEWTKLRPERVSHVVAVDQVAGIGAPASEFFVHSLPGDASSAALAELIIERSTTLPASSSPTLRRASREGGPVPPSPADAYVENAAKTGASPPSTVVVSGFDQQYASRPPHTLFVSQSDPRLAQSEAFISSVEPLLASSRDASKRA